MPNEIADAMSAAKAAGVEVLWNPLSDAELARLCLDLADKFFTAIESINPDHPGLRQNLDLADLTVAAIRRGLVARHYVHYQCDYTPSAGGVYCVAIGWSGREPIDAHAATELAALTACLRQMKEGKE